MFNTPLRYPGGKGRLTQYVIDLIEINDIIGGQYVEPYAGGAGIAISLLYLEYIEQIHLNDLSRAVFSFWHATCNQTDDLCRLVTDTDVTVDEWKRQKAIQKDPDADILALGFSTFFLNRTNRSGIINGGIIGGKDQSGPWKIDARFNRQDLTRRIQKIGSYASRIKLYNLDAVEFIRDSLPKIKSPSLVYLDPPYYIKGQELYENYYRHNDHAEIAGLISNVPYKWIVTYDNAQPVRDLYAGFHQQTFGLRYSAHARYEGAEIMIFGKDVKSPGPVESWRGIAA